MIKNYFPIDQSKSLKKKILIQPLFVDQKVKNSKEIKGLGDNKSWSSSSIIKAIEKDLKKGINNFLLFIVPNKKQKHPEDFSFHYEVIRKIKNAGFDIYTWTVNKREDIEKIKKLNVRFNSSFGRHLEYYTGLVFKIDITSKSGKLNIRGGRYDSLIKDLGFKKYTHMILLQLLIKKGSQ